MSSIEYDTLITKFNTLTLNHDTEKQVSVYNEIFSYLVNPQDFFQWPEQAQLAAIACLKSFLKDEASAKLGVSYERLETLSILTGLNHGGSVQQDQVTQEAMKCIANSLLLSQELRPLFCKLNATQIILERLLSREKLCLSTDTLFLYARLLFLATIEPSPLIICLIHDFKVSLIISELLNSFNFVTRSRPGFSEAMVAIDLLKLVFNLMVNYPKAFFLLPGYSLDSLSKTSYNASKLVEDPSEFIFEYFNCLFDPVVRVINLSMNSDSDGLFIACAQILFNFPPEKFTAELTSAIDYTKFGDYLINIILKPAREASYSGEYIDIYDRLAPCILLLSSLCRVHPSLKSKASNELLPSDKERENRIGESDSASSRLVAILTAGSIGGLKDALGELYFVLCDENVEEIVKKLGYGNVAGFLMNRQMGMLPKALGKFFVNPNDNKPINPITGQYHDSEATSKDSMTPDEKLREAERLFVLFERMKKNPIFKVRNPVEDMTYDKLVQSDPSDDSD